MKCEKFTDGWTNGRKDGRQMIRKANLSFQLKRAKIYRVFRFTKYFFMKVSQVNLYVLKFRNFQLRKLFAIDTWNAFTPKNIFSPVIYGYVMNGIGTRKVDEPKSLMLPYVRNRTLSCPDT